MPTRLAWAVGVLSLLIVMGCLPMSKREPGPPMGSPVPSLDGVDVAGQRLRLCDFRNKVVLLSFWHSGCGPCRGYFESEKALVQRYSGKPFVLLGVNGDESPFIAKQVHDAAGLTWSSWWDGPNGPIATTFAIDEYPSFYLLDRKGNVRLRQVGIPTEAVLLRKIDELLAEGKTS